jgi:1,2-diacylglycerol 3-alpha-glucosyltransferase
MALPHLVRDGENGYLFTPNDSDDLAKKITLILELPGPARKSWARPAGRWWNRTASKAPCRRFEDLYRGAGFEDKVV